MLHIAVRSMNRFVFYFFYKFIDTTFAVHIVLQQFRPCIILDDYMIPVQLRVCFNWWCDCCTTRERKGILEEHQFWFSPATILRPPLPPTPISEKRRPNLECRIIFSLVGVVSFVVDLLKGLKIKFYLHNLTSRSFWNNVGRWIEMDFQMKKNGMITNLY